jgi:prepilin-type N-terminal cleavage/methylation domain-containing protein
LQGQGQFTEGDMHTKQHSGFTLIELAVVVFIIGILASVGLATLKSQMESTSISATKKKQETMKNSLISYLAKYNRLPCPAIDNTGLESRVLTNAPANCIDNTGKSAYLGILPYATLGLPKSAALDGWENFFSYAVSTQWTLTYSTAAPVVGGTSTNVASQAFNVGDSGTIAVNNRSPATSSTPTPISSNAVVFIVSHGKNGLGAFTNKGTQNVSPAAGTDELANVPVPTTWAVPSAFYQREYTDIAVPTYGAFDDIAQFLNPRDLITPLILDGALQSAQSQWSQQITNINNALIGAMFNNSLCAPPANQAAFNALLTANGIQPVDPWGGTLTYIANFCRLNNNGMYKTSNCASDCGYLYSACSSPSTTFTAFTITSTTTPTLTIRPQTLSTLTVVNPSLLSNCPSP